MLTNPIVDDICNYIKQEILYERLSENERISERAIAEKFSVSRTLVREAIMVLKQEGFLYSKSKSGTYVSPPTPEVIMENYAARLALEGDIFLMAFPNIRLEDIDTMKRCCEDMLCAETLADYSKAEHKQHQLICERTKNRFVIDFINSMIEGMLQIGTKAGRGEGRRVECVEEWRRIIKCIENNDPMYAKIEFINHIRNSRDAYERYYQKLKREQ